ncbi:2-iminoacetate synthase ThiH [Bowmanella dokdonensis]|uniref:2-iminoacetate synthase ThiH n=1 Tax=Bowmanella dokdonensis TaxID=751969 RepID=A0A939DNZ9_9ALTE|nr:2-iminoacetate synthase ThiH [Bowmanella dokdonensis]MBN7826294.1 2-iminoacetate synthase ThiH [Bowmanella dokdonensis]
MSFIEQFKSLEWDDISLRIRASTPAQVELALVREKRGLNDLMALLSPAAEPYLEQMARQSWHLTRQRFGHTLQFFLPLYLSNLCANECDYCGFSMSNRIKRKTLTEDEIERECRAIKAMGFDSLLLVTGEHEAKVGMDYFRRVLPRVKAHFSYLMMEVQPLGEQDYRELTCLGLDAVMVYQETYQPRTYARHHLKGNKQDFAWRLDTPDRLGRAGIDKIGLGVLLGLDDWRTDSLMTAAHLRYLQQTYWRSRFSLSFPRLRPCTGNQRQVQGMTNKQLVQLICAYRLFDQEVELSLSTRESASFRDSVLPLGITSLSAGSSTQPGGYAGRQQALEQFAVDDSRSPAQVAQAVAAAGLQPIWTDWQRSFSGGY